MDVQQQPRSALTAARRRKGWTLRQAAKILGCGCSTLNRWENGEQTPHPDYVRRLCEIYGATSVELGLEESVPSRHIVIVGSRYPSIMAFIEQDLTSRLMTIIANWPHSGRHDELQCRLLSELGDYNSMKTDRDTISRREAVLRLAAVPFTAFGLAATETTDSVPSHPTEEVLKHWAGSIAACWELSKGNNEGDVRFAFESVSAFLPTLISIIENSSQYRKTAASLAGQCYLLKTILGWHQESLDRAIGYAQQAVTYSEIANDIPLQIAVQVKLAWVYYYAKQDVKALEAVTHADNLAKTSLVSLPPDLQSSVQTALAIRQAMHGKLQQAITAVRLAHHYFFETSNAKKAPGIDKFIYADYDRPSLILEDGIAHAHLDQHDKALDSFSQIVDPNDLSSKISVPERVRVEVLNNQVFSLLKSSEKDKETSIKLWKAGVQEARALRSEQRFSEAMVAYEMMKGIWPKEKDIKELRELALHW